MKTFLTMEEIEKAGHYEICRMRRFHPLVRTQDHVKILSRILERYRELGGMTPEISKRLGWNP